MCKDSAALRLLTPANVFAAADGQPVLIYVLVQAAGWLLVSQAGSLGWHLIKPGKGPTPLAWCCKRLRVLHWLKRHVLVVLLLAGSNENTFIVTP